MHAIRPISTHFRLACGLAAVLAVAILLEIWARLGVVPWHLRGSPTWHRAWNRTVHRWGRWTTRVAKAFLGIRVEVEGTLPSSGRYLLVSNHQSSIDVPFLIDLLEPLNLKFVAHGGLRYYKPFVSFCLRNGGMAVIDKTNLSDDLWTLRRFAGTLDESDGSPMIFPEGIRTFDGTMGPFWLAGTHALQAGSGLPVLPVVHDGLWKARTIREVGRLANTTLKIVVLDPVPPERFADDPRAAYAAIESSIRDGLARIRGEVVPEEAVPEEALVSMAHGAGRRS